jgi:Cys-tRNA(Pro) deacylase
VNWPEPVERVAGYLRSAGAEGRVEEFASETPTAAAAAEAIGCEPGQVVKSLVLICDGKPLVALVPGDRRADLGKIASAAGGARARVASPQEVESATGFVAGAVAPFPLPAVHRVLVERTLLARDVVWVGAGSTRHMASLAPAELVRLARAQPVDAVADS